MFYNRGEVISDQFDHLKVIGFRVSVVLFWKKTAKTGLFGYFLNTDLHSGIALGLPW